MDKAGMLKIVKDIRFWILLFFLIRLFGITDAPLEAGHNWRQSLTNMMARNFFEVSSNIFFPRIDMAGDDTGILGSEFPLFSYLIFLFAKLFGYDHWYGRLINLVVSSISFYYFYLIVRRYFNQNIAFNATLILLASIWFSFSRKIMPDTFSVALVIIGLYYGLMYFEKGKSRNLILFFGFTTLGILCKIPALSLMSLLAIPLFSNYKSSRKMAVFASGTLTVLLVSVWYFYWVPYLVETYHFKLFFPKGLVEGFNEIREYPIDTLDKFWFTSFYSFVAFIFFIAGLVMMAVKKNRLLFYVFITVSLVFFVFILKTGSVFSLHNYYIIPYTPLMALVAGYGLSFVKIPWSYVIMLLIVVESLINQSYDFFIKESEFYKLEIESSIEGSFDHDKLIIVNGTKSPQTMYFLHRKGWSISNEELLEPNAIDRLIEKGADYLIIDKHTLDHTFFYPMIYQDENLFVYKLRR